MKKLCLFLFSAFLAITSLWAQTGGPGQPEFMQFQQAGTANLVNPASGTFSYQIPLFSIGGYPMNLTYQSGVMMEDVASMVGWGWNLNLGAIVRTMRYLPDDFAGDQIIKEYSVAPNITYGGKLGADLEFAGLSKKIDTGKLPGEHNLGLTLSAELGVFYNTYRKWGRERSISGNLSYSFMSKKGAGASASLGLGSSINSQGGVDRYISPNLGLKFSGNSQSLSLSLGHTWSVNSTEGLKKSLNTNLSYTKMSEGKGKGLDSNNDKTDSQASSESAGLMSFSHNSYLNNSFQLNLDHPFINESGNFSGTFGWDAYYVDPSVRITGYYSVQRLATTQQQFPAYGTLNEQQGLPANALLDFNREKQMPYLFGESDILPIPFRTPDVFNLSAQGLAMSFSAFRNDVGVVGDPGGWSIASGENLGAEIGFGDVLKAGANLGTNISTQNSERLSPANFNVQHEQQVFGSQLYRQCYFKNLSEVNKFDPTHFSIMGNHGPVQFDITSSSTAASAFIGGNALPTIVQNQNQPVRQSNIEYLTVGETMATCLGNRFTYYDFKQPDVPIRPARFEDVGMGYRSDHHLGKFIVTQPDGMVYEFGIPVYNTLQKEVSFNLSGAKAPSEDNLVPYTTSGATADDSVTNVRGNDHHFESTTTPPYATQFLITAVLSSDYRDITGDGISEDDLGNYVKFEYYKEDFEKQKGYRWRTPFEAGMATFNAGLHTDAKDDHGSYVYGEKEIWYPKLVESKIEVAEFHYSQKDKNPRLDGFGVVGPDGGKNLACFLRRLDSIVVYSLPDRKQNGSQATPVKTIRFHQDYTLCLGNKNTQPDGMGKLTLNSLDITYAHSEKGKLSPYQFEYGKMPSGKVVNPSYSILDVNRWGYYQPNPENASTNCLAGEPLSSIEYPYALQDKFKMDEYAYAWNLTGITIPGGGKLYAEYEAHDYGYVQDKTAGQMFPVAGLGTTEFMVIGNNRLYEYSSHPLYSLYEMMNAKPYNRIFFKLKTPITGDPASQKAILKQHYLQDLQEKYLYFKFLVKLSDDLQGARYEYISGYAKVKDYGVVPNDNMHAYIDVEAVDLDEDKSENGKCSTILKAALQFMRINRNDLVYDQAQLDDPKTLREFIETLQSAREQMKNQKAAFEMGLNLYCKTKKFCHEICLDKSFIRLYSPDQFKLAGGSRVHKVSIDDNWNKMADNPYKSKQYTTVYDYTAEKEDLIQKKMVKISSGVADYEPLVGGDEISLKQPIFYSDAKKKAPDTEYYVEEPINESLFPAPQITYSKVTEVSNPTTLTNVAKTGKIVHEFFTAKDFPVKVDLTPIDQARDMTGYKTPTIPFLLFPEQHDFAMVSQGFSIELNNMSGMPKATWVYNENGDRISGEETEYFSSNHEFTTIDRNGAVHPKTAMGLSVLYTVDGRKTYDETTSSTFNANFNLSVPGFPVPLLVPLFSQVVEKKQFQSLVTNKIVQRNGVIKKKTVHSQSASISTENIAFDEVTGEVLLTKTTNEFNDSLYSFKYPAWWIYGGMGPAYMNSKMLVTDANKDLVKQFLKPGDELRSLGGNQRLWVKDAKTSPPTFMTADDKSAPLGTRRYIVYDPIAENLLASPAGQVVTWKWNPILQGGKINFGQDHILNSSVVQYYDGAVMYCDTCNLLANRLDKNVYLSGKKGNYKSWRTWFHLADRSSTEENGQTSNLRQDGLFKTYNDFWLLPTGNNLPWGIDSIHWEWKERVNLTDTDGQTIETEDRIGRKTGNVLGYRNNLVIAQAVNAGYGETYFDGFEDYEYSFCNELVFWESQQTGNSSEPAMKRVRKEGGNLNIVQDESHTGKYAVLVEGQLNFTIDPPKPCPGTAFYTPATNLGLNWAPGTNAVTNGTSTTIPNPNSNNVIVTNPGTVSSIPTNPPCIECIGGFNPLPAKEYIFSAWVMVKKTAPVVNCAEAKVTVSAPGRVPVILYPSGPVIEGWQRIEGKFSTSNSSNKVSVTLKKGLNYDTYYDDLRIFPADGNMASYVYDDVKLKLTYTLDENNYFTKYEYNNQGELIRIKRETEDGIVTQKEGNSGIVKQ